jgi:thiamine-phosphate pyrophosphorylase
MSAALDPRLRVLLVADAGVAGGRPLVPLVAAALEGGILAVQLRAKAWGAGQLLATARELRKITAAAGALFFVNDRLDVALLAGADGAHLGDDDLPLPLARRISPSGFLLGRSAVTPEELRRARDQGADYAGAGPVFGTASKDDAGPAIGVRSIHVAAAAGLLPIVGIGGVTAANAAEVLRAGAAGVAVLSAVIEARDPREAAAVLVRACSPPTSPSEAAPA